MMGIGKSNRLLCFMSFRWRGTFQLIICCAPSTDLSILET
jgi:hypothetical protein